MPKATDTERFWTKFERRPDGCWQWLAGFAGEGYGSFYLDHRMLRAHIAAYELLVGAVPRGLELDHLCRNRACVNPAHLEPVTFVVNIMRGEGAGAKNARKTHCVHGHPFSPENTAINARGHRKCIACNRENVRAWRAARA